MDKKESQIQAEQGKEAEHRLHELEVKKQQEKRRDDQLAREQLQANIQAMQQEAL